MRTAELPVVAGTSLRCSALLHCVRRCLQPPSPHHTHTHTHTHQPRLARPRPWCSEYGRALALTASRAPRSDWTAFFCRCSQQTFEVEGGFHEVGAGSGCARLGPASRTHKSGTARWQCAGSRLLAVAVQT